jgi:hypothetical protein
MKRKVFFCKSWFRAKKCPTEIWTRDDALCAFHENRPFTILVDSIDAPFCFIECVREVIVVGFLDDRGREKLTYVFEKNDERNVFLIQATYREYQGDTDKIASGSLYLFDRNGTVSTTHTTYDPKSIEKATSLVDVKKNFSAIPEFGEYDDLIRVERT